MLVLRALEATVSKDAPATPLQGKTILHRGHFVLLSYLSLSCIYLNMVKRLIGGREFFGCFFLYLFYVQRHHYTSIYFIQKTNIWKQLAKSQEFRHYAQSQ